jgi:L-fuconate dehydratase
VSETIAAVHAYDLRFPTSRHLDGSDAIHPAPDYSAAYVVLRTTSGDEGYGLAFTVGRGNEIQVTAIQALAPLVVGLPVAKILANLGDFTDRLPNDGALRWLGPAKGIIHMAVAAVVNAAWDLAARRAGKPLWRLLADLSPEQVVSLVDFRYRRDAMTPDDALDILHRARADRADRAERAERERQLATAGYPAYTSTPGWLGYDDAKLVRLCREAVAQGFGLIKLKVGADPDDDVRRMRLAREAVGPDVSIAIDANQAWGVAETIRWMRVLAPFAPYWIEEPTSPDDVLGHAAIRAAVRPVKVATGEHVQNAVVFKQLLQAQAVDIVQIDACRVAGVTENVAILLFAAKFGVPVCPHAGGVGLCEMVQHLSMFDYLAVSGSWEGRVIEYVDHLHEHFEAPVHIHNGRYRVPLEPGGGRILPASAAAYSYPDGPVWTEVRSDPQQLAP